MKDSKELIRAGVFRGNLKLNIKVEVMRGF